MIEKYLGKITHISFGLGGYQDVQFGLSVTLEGQGVGTNVFIGAWDYNWVKEPGEHAKWTEEERTKIMIELLRKVSDLLKAAKVKSVDQLKGKPIAMTFEDMTLKDWRILEEVL